MQNKIRIIYDKIAAVKGNMNSLLLSIKALNLPEAERVCCNAGSPAFDLTQT